MRAATDTLRDIAGGELVEDLGEALRALNLSVAEAERGGELTMKIKLKPAGRGSGAIEVSYDLKTTPPKLPKRASIMWGTPEGDLLCSDPAQGKLELRQVDNTPAAAGPLRQAS